MTIERKLTGLPIGTGAAIGAFIRSLYMTASSRYAIIGISVNNQGLFEKLGANTTLISDVVFMFTAGKYALDEKVVESGTKIGKSCLGDVYEIGLTFSNVSVISTDSCKHFYKAESSKSIQLLEPLDELRLVFYICKVQGRIREEIASSALTDVLPADSISRVIPVTATGKRNTRCWSTLTSHKFTEDVELHFEGNDDECSQDLNELLRLFTGYCGQMLDILTDVTNTEN